MCRAADQERLPGKRMYFLFQHRALFGKFAGQPRQHRAVHFDAGAFHLRQHRHQWAVHQFIHTRDFFGGKAQFQMVPQPQSNIGILGGVFGRLGQGHFGKADLAFACAGQGFVADRFVTQMQFGQLIHAMPLPPRIKRKAHQHGIVERVDRKPMLAQH